MSEDILQGTKASLALAAIGVAAVADAWVESGGDVVDGVRLIQAVKSYREVVASIRQMETEMRSDK